MNREMEEDDGEIDIVGAFGATPMHGERFAIYIPNKDRDGNPVDRRKWVRAALELLSTVGGGATAMPPVTGAWLNPDTGKLIFEEPVVVYAYVKPEKFQRDLSDLVSFVKQLGRQTNQGEVALEYDGSFFTVSDFS